MSPWIKITDNASSYPEYGKIVLLTVLSAVLHERVICKGWISPGSTTWSDELDRQIDDEVLAWKEIESESPYRGP
jgi:hypothetical protein